MRILVVDDSQVMRDALEEVLVTAGFSVSTASNGIEGLDQLNKKKFDLLFLDIDMPNLSGLQVCRMLRNDTRFRNFPIIMLTARDKKKDQFWGIETGADAYLTKPFDPDELIQKVNEVLNEKQKPSEVIQIPDELPPDDEAEISDVIFKAGELQEIQLFKMTLFNKIYSIANTMQDLKHTCHAIANLYASVIDFDIAMFLLSDEDRIKLFVYVYKPINREFFLTVRKKMMELFKSVTDKKDLLRDKAEVELHDPEHNMLRETGELDLKAFESVVLESKGDKFGMFTMSRSGREGNGEFKPEEINTAKLISNQSSIVIDNVRMYEKIKRYAVADGLTGLYNHRYFQEQLEKEFSRARRFNLALSLIMMDIDHFKQINDSFGHQQGDMILKEMSKILRRSVRDIDLIARYGGEEFVIILPETPKKNANIVADRIRYSLENYEFKRHGEEPLHATASFGVSGYPDDDIKTQLDLIAKSDEALYRAKKEGRNRVILYSSEGRNYT
ncbi:MAG TPA: diguanylate cyclase [bacterium]|nr:diguanylate cyclase [bacterium]